MTPDTLASYILQIGFALIILFMLADALGILDWIKEMIDKRKK
jgi:hypothetical protein